MPPKKAVGFPPLKCRRPGGPRGTESPVPKKAVGSQTTLNAIGRGAHGGRSPLSQKSRRLSDNPKCHRPGGPRGAESPVPKKP
jgi:hypothetical protein